MAKSTKKKTDTAATKTTSAWANLLDIDTENDPYWKKVREDTKDALTCPHCNQLYFLCDAKDEDTGVVICPECDTKIE